MNKKALIILADGCEEIEAVTPIDVLRRAGVEVTVAGLSGKVISGAQGIKLEADLLLSEYQPATLPDIVILPGGAEGARNLSGSSKVSELIKAMHGQKRLIAAICASPAVALSPTGILKDRKVTCYPSFEKFFPKDTVFLEDRVVVDDHIITSRGPGTALEFALKIVEQLVSKEKALTLRDGMLVKMQ